VGRNGSSTSLEGTYKVLRVLERAPECEVMLAVDRRTGVEVTVRVAGLDVLSDEVRHLLEATRPPTTGPGQFGVPGVIDTVNDGDHLYVITPYVEGVSLRGRLEEAVLDVGEALLLARHVLGALAQVHSTGALHRDVKPDNVMVDRCRPIQRATLVDFDVVTRLLSTSEASEHVRRSSRYMAPEMAGVLDRPVDRRADLYAAGITLFECLAGRPPFEKADLQGILRDQLSMSPPRLRTLGVPVPQAFEEILCRLLHKDPDDRYASAEAALADVNELDSALRNGVTEPELSVGSRDRRATLTEPALTGRENEVAFLHRGLADATRGVSATVTLEAGSGGGKTRVLEEFRERAVLAGARVFRGGGLEQSEQRPLQMFAGLVEDVIEYARAAPSFAARLGSRLAGESALLCDALPGLREILDRRSSRAPASLSDSVPNVGTPLEASTPPGDRLAQTRLVAALAKLLGALGSEREVAVVCLDDCQWADDLTLQVLEAWASRAAEEEHLRRHVLVVVAMRTEEPGPHRRLAGIAGVERLPLPALDLNQVSQVVESMAGEAPPDVTRVVFDLSLGNPLMVSAVLRGLVEVEALSATPDGWKLTSGPESWQASRKAATLLARRFAVLDPSTRRLLDAGAVLGREFSLTLAAVLAGQERAGAEQAIRQAVQRHLVWAGEDGTIRFAHDRLRASLLAELDPAERVALHRRAAECIDPGDPAHTFDLAYHFDAAGEPERALPHALESAAAARSRHDFELAEWQYRIAERGASGASESTQYAIAEALGQILTLRGRYDEAETRLERAHALAPSTKELAWIEGQLGELLFRRDDLEGAAAVLESALRTLGERIPPDRGIRLVVRLVWEIFRRLAAGHGRRRTSGDTAGDDQADRLKVYLYTRLLYPRWFHERRLQNLCLMLRQINVSERCPQGTELAHAYSIWGAALALTFPPLWRHGMAYIERGESIYRRRGDRRGEGHMASMRACVLHAAGRYEDAVRVADEAIQTLAEFGDRWELGFATRSRALCLYRLGRFRDAAEEARRVIGIGLEVGDANAEVTGLEVLARATGGRVLASQTRTGLSYRGNDIEVAVAAVQAEALRLRGIGQLSEAIDHLDQAVRMVRRAQPTNLYLVPVFAWMATLRREFAEKPILPEIRRRRLAQARRSARCAVRFARLYPNERPHALRELGIVCALSGQRRRARRHLNRSATLAERSGASAELSETGLQRERLRLDRGRDVIGDEGGDRPEVSGEREIPSLGLAARFTALLEAGVLLTSTDSTEEIRRAVRESVLAVLRADSCRVVGLTAEWRQDRAANPAWENAAVDRAAGQRRPRVLDGPADVEDGWDASHARSALCAPVFVRGTMAGYFLAFHSQVDKLFGEEELRLAEFVARLAGAALERHLLHRDSRARVIDAQEAERARVARDLHDEIGQALTSVLLGVRLVENSLSVQDYPPAEGNDVLARTEELRTTAASALESVQRLAFDLRPAVLDDLGLVAAVRRLTASGITGHMHVELETVDLDAGQRMPAEIEITAYRVAQEAITNVVRHACAANCGVVIGRAQQRLRVVVEDDGVGFDPAGDSVPGLGLQGMRERAALIGGTLRVESAPGRGTSVVFEVHIE
jgi:signal transduction histidine kinase